MINPLIESDPMKHVTEAKVVVDWAAAITLSHFIFTAEQITAINKALEAKFKGYRI